MEGGIFSVDQLKAAMRDVGVRHLYAKELAPNDNSKNQPYLGSSLEVVNLLPVLTVSAARSERGEMFKAQLPFSWLTADGNVVPAPGAQLIVYPQYPEVRLSGFLRGSHGAPNDVMTSRQAGRTLYLGVTADRSIVAWATFSADHARYVASLSTPATGVLKQVPIFQADGSRGHLLSRLADIAAAQWLPSQRLHSNGALGPCKGSNCGGYTLEAHFGIVPNGRAEPDFEGWEIKAHSVASFDRCEIGQLTLMTPEPTGGLYRDRGPLEFVRTYGYPDRSGIQDRLNFSSPHRTGVKNLRTGLMLVVSGFSDGAVTDADGNFSLVTKDGEVAASWRFTSLLEHWNKKHSKAVYVPYLSRITDIKQYRYGHLIRLGEGTDFGRFLSALASGRVCYDPGIKVENSTGPSPALKRRSQFRIRSADLSSLYQRFETIDLS
jgi:hypothetical protein